jgi:DNA-binding NarL/FixJ family response regulator
MTPRSHVFDNSHNPEKTLMIALVDDHELLLGGLAKALGDAPQIGAVDAYQQPAKLIDDLQNGRQFDLVVSDMLLGNSNGLNLAEELHSRFQTPVLLMTGVDAPPSRSELERHKVKGFVHKSAPVEVLYDAILAVASGQPYHQFPDGWDPEKTHPEFGRQSGQKAEQAGDILLSERQIEVLKLVAAGASNKEIASSLDITENTVKTHMKHIFNALGVTKRTACVLAAKSRGLVD